jgi:multiple sugar transport system ATP-binding protein
VQGLDFNTAAHFAFVFRQGSSAMSQSGAPLSLSAVSKDYGRVRALNGLSFDVKAGQFFALFGPSSVGKTTTLRTIAGLVKPDSGRVTIAGRDVTDAPIAGRGVSMVFQSFALYPHLSVYDNFAYPLREAKVASAEIDKRVKETAETLKLSHRLERKPNTLSGGEQQRVALGRSLIRRPSILLLDEPLTNLDAKLRNDMRAELKRLHRQFGITIIYATPDELEALSMGEEIAVMRDGAVVQQGSPDELYESPADLYVAGKIGSPNMNFIDAKVGREGASLDTPIGVISLPKPIVGLAAGEKAIMGVRPSDIRIAAAKAMAIKLPVHMLEPLGDVTVVSVEAPGQQLRMVLAESQAAGMKPGDALQLSIDPERVHVFRPHDGVAVRSAA